MVLHFILKKTDDFFSHSHLHRPLQSNDLFSCRRLTTRTYTDVVYPVFFLNSATNKLILVGCHPLDGVTRGGAPP